MNHLTRALVRRWLEALLHIDDTPDRTAAAFALGVFFGFSPLLGLSWPPSPIPWRARS